MSRMPPFSSLLKSREVEDPVNLWMHRPIAYVIASGLYRTPVTPNQMTLVAMLVGFAAGALWLVGTPTMIMIGGILLWSSSILDGVDGILARAKNMSSDIGRALDGTADVFVVTATVVPAFIYLLRTYDQVSLVTLLAMMVVAVITTLPQIYLYDYYKEVYLHATRPGEERRRESVDKAEARAAKAKAEGAPIWVRFSLNAYVGVLKNQQRVVRLLNPASIDIERSETTEKSAEIFRRHNHGPMQLWTFISLCPHSYLLAIAAIIGRFDLYLWFRVVGANALFIIALIWQRHASSRTLAEAEQSGLDWPGHHHGHGHTSVGGLR